MAPRDHPGGPWEQPDGHEVANDMIFVDFRMISGAVYVSFSGSKCIKIVFFQACFQVIFCGFLIINFDYVEQVYTGIIQILNPEIKFTKVCMESS